MEKLKNLSIILMITFILVMLMPISNAAGLTIAFSKNNANVGDTVNVTVNGNGISGKITLSVSGNAKLNKSSVWVENSSETITAQITGEGNVTITATPVDASDSVTAQPFTTATSGTIKVTKQNDPTTNPSTTTTSNSTTTEKSKVATLSNLGIKPNDFSGFKPNTFSYNTQVGNEIESIEIYASKGQQGQKISGTGKKTLKEGTNSFNIVVTAEDGKSQKTYTINVNRKEKDEKDEEVENNKPDEDENLNEKPKEEVFGLSQLKIGELEIEPQFQTDVYEYKLQLKENIEKLDITTVATEENCNIEITGNDNLQEGENIITVIVKDEKQEKVATYQIIVNKILSENTASSEQNEKEKIRKIAIISVIGIIIFIIFIIIIVKINKSKELDKSYIPYENLTNDYDNYEIDNKNVENNKYDELFENKTKKKKRSKGKRFK